jgi:hypothetical protein
LGRETFGVKRIPHWLVFSTALFLLGACATQPPVATGLPTPHREFRLGAFLSALAGPDAIDCGSSPYDADRSAIDACAVAAFRSNRPFHATYESSDREIDDILWANGFIRTAHNGLFFFTYDFAPYHSEDPPESFTFHACSKARVVSGLKGHETIACW